MLLEEKQKLHRRKSGLHMKQKTHKKSIRHSAPICQPGRFDLSSRTPGSSPSQGSAAGQNGDPKFKQTVGPLSLSPFPFPTPSRSLYTALDPLHHLSRRPSSRSTISSPIVYMEGMGLPCIGTFTRLWPFLCVISESLVCRLLYPL